MRWRFTALFEDSVRCRGLSSACLSWLPARPSVTEGWRSSDVSDCVTPMSSSLPRTPTVTALPSGSSPERIMWLRRETRWRSSQRLIGRAPSSGSWDSWRTRSTASSVSSSAMSSSSRRRSTSFSCRRTTWRSTSPLSGLKTMTSSRRFRSSGLSVRRMTAMVFSFACSISAGEDFLAATRSMCSAPRLDVMSTMQCLQSITWPWESVMRPSSSSWRRTLSTCGCAFSISSKSTTL
mmetsp:Transcript_55110/g.162015  ORF Transcript_55110/g.162015 Transcript_55110/m.162015 type:complete len:236 (-) Transcript_55110:2072-2779(-)